MSFKSILIISLNAIILSILLLSCDSNGIKSFNQNMSYNDLKVAIWEKEKENPLEFLSIDGTYRSNLVDEWVLEGNIANSAIIANYKDIVIKVSFYSKTKTLIGTENLTIYDYFPAGEYSKFKLKTTSYNEAYSISWEIVRASISE